MNLRTSFSTLGIGPGTDEAQAKSAYKAQVRRWHPDQFPEGSADKAGAEEQLKRINIAYARVKAHLSLHRPDATVTNTATPTHPDQGGDNRHAMPGGKSKKRSWINHLFDRLNAHAGNRRNEPSTSADDTTVADKRKNFGQVLDEMAGASIFPKRKRQPDNPATTHCSAPSSQRLYARKGATVGKVRGAEDPGPIKPVGRIRGIGRSR